MLRGGLMACRALWAGGAGGCAKGAGFAAAGVLPSSASAARAGAAAGIPRGYAAGALKSSCDAVGGHGPITAAAIPALRKVLERVATTIPSQRGCSFVRTGGVQGIPAPPVGGVVGGLRPAQEGAGVGAIIFHDSKGRMLLPQRSGVSIEQQEVVKEFRADSVKRKRKKKMNKHKHRKRRKKDRMKAN
mmetsp:Transcript_35605/g.112297  ORF Transcript_35605/g.112297 Transcript_35605/m.112297 type:complete len:188 (-) Transcript_35605:70-633(-)